MRHERTNSRSCERDLFFTHRHKDLLRDTKTIEERHDSQRHDLQRHDLKRHDLTAQLSVFACDYM
jgi:hypothetical protein